jgi:hypothetical protein
LPFVGLESGCVGRRLGLVFQQWLDHDFIGTNGSSFAKRRRTIRSEQLENGSNSFIAKELNLMKNNLVEEFGGPVGWCVCTKLARAMQSIQNAFVPDRFREIGDSSLVNSETPIIEAYGSSQRL